ncbi:unnamed protein product [Phyllotreta striolata]|uniref:Protein FAM114A2 n=1 Tax=Phyllotreta striolata TaxID=444603 RepID=A0A9N9TDL9_PHYSR|nr:unnamed protein product [Phyllotreta striolata]
METSDSEYFESADEELYSDSDDEYVGKGPKKCINIIERKLSNANISEDSIVKDRVCDNFEINSDVDDLKTEIDPKSDDNTLVNKEKNDEVSNIKSDTIKKEKNDNIQVKEHEKFEKTNTESLSQSNQEKVVESNSKDLKDGPIPTALDLEENMWDNEDIDDLISNNDETNRNTKYDNEKQDLKTDEIKNINEVNSNTLINKEPENEQGDSNLIAPQDDPASNSNEENMWEDNEDWNSFSTTKKEPDTIKQPVIDTSDTAKNIGTKNPKDVNTWDGWDNDDWETLEKTETSQKDETKPETSWSGWGNWGVSSILTTATQGVSTLTNQVSQGFTTVLETGIGIPDPKELAKQDRIIEEHINESEGNRGNLGFGFSNFVSGVSHLTKFVENTGTKVITGGLDTLETIGKKTMEVLQEGDPGLKNKRALLKLDKEKPTLSQMLREAKERSETDNQILKEENYKKKINYETLFDDYHGLVHLEALEMLSKQCDIKLQTLSDNCTGKEYQDLQETMDQIKELCELPDEEDEEVLLFSDIKEKIQTAVNDIKVKITYDKLFSTCEESENWLNTLKLDFCDETDIHREALQVLAQITAIAVEQFHKCGELLLIKEQRSTADEADSLVQLTMAVTSLISLVAANFSKKLNAILTQTENKDSISELITNVFFEASNSSSYVQDAFQLLIPVLQVGAI